MCLNQCNTNTVTVHVTFISNLWHHAPNKSVYFTTISLHAVFLQSCPAVQAASSHSARCLHLPHRLTPALVHARHPTLKSACRGRPCLHGARPARAAREATRAQALTRHSFTTAGCSTATSPWRPGEHKQLKIRTAPWNSFVQLRIFVWPKWSLSVFQVLGGFFYRLQETCAAFSCHWTPSDENIFK